MRHGTLSGGTEVTKLPLKLSKLSSVNLSHACSTCTHLLTLLGTLSTHSCLSHDSVTILVLSIHGTPIVNILNKYEKRKETLTKSKYNPLMN